MERNFFDSISSSIVVLNWFLTTNIKNFNNFVGTSTGDTSTVGVELNRCDSLVMIVECVDMRL